MIIIYCLNDKILIPHPSFLGVHQNEAKIRALQIYKYVLGVETKQKIKLTKGCCTFLLQHWDFFIGLLHFWKGDGCSRLISKKILMEKCVTQYRCFFICFVSFTSNFVCWLVNHPSAWGRLIYHELWVVPAPDGIFISILAC